MTPPAPPTILILGAGAIGAFYGSLLAHAHLPPSPSAPLVSAVCRSNYPAVAAAGFRITSPTYGAYTWRPAQTFASPAAARGRAWDYVVVATKAASGAGGVLEGLVEAGRTRVVVLQNGLGVEGEYADRCARVLGGVTVCSATQVEAGVVAHNRWTRVSVGPYGAWDGGEAEAAGFVGLLREAGVADAEACDARGLQLLRWHKVAINAAMNPSSVLSGGTANGDMARDGEVGRHLVAVMREVLDTAVKVCGVDKLPDKFASPERILESTRRNDSGSRPSMWFDWEAGRKMELEAILWEPIKAAREKGLEMPRLESMYALLKMAQRNRDVKQGDDEGRGSRL